MDLNMSKNNVSKNIHNITGEDKKKIKASKEMPNSGK